MVKLRLRSVLSYLVLDVCQFLYLYKDLSKVSLWFLAEH